MTINLYHIKGYRPYKLYDLKITYNTLYMIKSIKIQKKLASFTAISQSIFKKYSGGYE